MPRPIKNTQGVSFHIEHVRQRPKHIALLDLVASEWQVVEVQLFEVFMTLCGGKPEFGTGGTIFDHIESLQTKLNLVGRFLAIRTPDLSAEFQRDIRPLIQDVARKRNTLMSAEWGVMDKYPDDIILLRMSGGGVRYALKDLEAILAQVTDAQSRIGEFADRVETAISGQ